MGRLFKNRNDVNLTVSSMDDLINVIIPHFDKYPVGKLMSYLIFRTAVMLIKEKVHLDAKGFLSILDLCYFTDSTSVRNLKSLKMIQNAIYMKFGSIDFTKSIIDFKVVAQHFKTYNPYYVAGLLDASLRSGCIAFSFSSVKRKVTSSFSVTMGIDDYSVVLGLISFFWCGKVYISTTQEIVTFRVIKLQDLIKAIQPFLEDIKLSTIKQEYLVNTFSAWDILSTQGVKKDADLQHIVNLVYNINQVLPRGGAPGKLRKIDKESYLSLFILTD